MPQDCVKTNISFWNLTGALTGLLLRYLSNSRRIRQFQTPHILLLQDFTRSHKKMSDNKGLAFVYSPLSKDHRTQLEYHTLNFQLPGGFLRSIAFKQWLRELVILKPWSMLTSSSHYHSKVWQEFLRTCWLFCLISKSVKYLMANQKTRMSYSSHHCTSWWHSTVTCQNNRRYFDIKYGFCIYLGLIFAHCFS